MKLEKLTNGELQIEILKEGNELKELKKEVLAKFKNVKVDGFRKGHVPEDVIEKEFSEDIKSELLNSILNKSYVEILKDESIKIAGDLSVIELVYEKELIKIVGKLPLFPEFEVPKYKDLGIEEEKATVSDEELESEIEKMLNSSEKFEKSDKESVENGDIAVIDFEGFVDGEAFQGGKAENYKLKIGSKSFIDNFEDQIIGHKVGEEFDVNVNFPEEYHSEALKGKPAVFKIKLNSIEVSVKPELNDEFAKTLGSDTVEDLKNTLKGRLLSNKESKAKRDKLAKILDTLSNTANFEVSPVLVENEIHRQIDGFANQLRMQGANLEDYLKMTNNTIEKMHEDLKPNAEKSVKVSFILSKISEIEGLKVEKEEFEAELNKIASMYGMTVEQLNSELDKANTRRDYYVQIESGIMSNKINNFLAENN